MTFPEPFYRWRPHPWHGLDAGPDVPKVVRAFIEITPFDVVKYELEKKTGFLRVDRPQRSSSQPPCLYGLIPRTYCGDRVRALNPGAERGDGDPLDICVLSERPITRAEVVLEARVVGGIPMLDGGEADDKIVTVLVHDTIWDDVEHAHDLPPALLERMRHYFSTYKIKPGEPNPVELGETYGVKHAHKVIEAAIADYEEEYGS